MKLTQITVSYGETQSLPQYSNVKPNLTFTATLDEGDDVAAVEAELWAMAKAHVHEQIDRALEANSMAAKHSTELRYQVLQTYWNEWDHRGEEKPPQYVVILPNEVKIERGAYAQRLIGAAHEGDNRKLRYEHALAVARDVIRNSDDNPTLLDCSNGDLTLLNLALSAPESNPEVAPEIEHPF